MFALIVSSYVITVIGIPVYYHYCGGQLEQITYVIKSNSCCEGEEDDSQEASNGCCKDENVILKSDVDFTIKDLNDYAFVKTFSEVFYIVLPFSISLPEVQLTLTPSYFEPPPPKLHQDLLVSTFVLRI